MRVKSVQEKTKTFIDTYHLAFDACRGATFFSIVNISVWWVHEGKFFAQQILVGLRLVNVGRQFFSFENLVFVHVGGQLILR